MFFPRIENNVFPIASLPDLYVIEHDFSGSNTAHMAMPFHRQEHFQSLIGFPLPTSTQWQLMEELTSSALLVFPTLETIAANGHLIHNDDTVLRIVDIIRYNRQNPGQKRTGMFTTGILAQNRQNKIAIIL